MKVLVYPLDKTGCGNYRAILPAEALAAQGFDVTVDYKGPTMFWDREWHGDFAPPAAQVLGLAERPDADVVVMQRPTWLPRLQAIGYLQQAGVKVVVDIDDRLDQVSKDHLGHADFKLGYANHRYLDEACRMADVVTATTPQLLSRYGYGHGVLLPNLVPERYLTISTVKRPRSVGWSGVVGTHPGDLQQTGNTVQPLLDSTKWGFHSIGPADGIQQALGLRDEPSATGWVLFDDYAYLLAELEAGIVPLEPSVFNEAKSCLKAMEMAALGVPVVMSPTPDNLRLHSYGVGLVAESRGQWRRQLGRLLASPDLRAQLAEAGRVAAGRLTYEQHCGRWAEAWQSTIEARSAA